MEESVSCKKVEISDQDGPFPLAPGESFVTCPYNASHRVTNHRFFRHLTRCRRNYLKEMEFKKQEVAIVPCPFNFTHQIPTQELQHHRETCEDQWPVLLHINSMTSEDLRDRKFELCKRNQAFTSQQETAKKDEKGDEDWEISLNASGNRSYDPKPKIESGGVILTPKCLTASEKRAEQDRNRVKFAQYLKSQENIPISGIQKTFFLPKPQQVAIPPPITDTSNRESANGSIIASGVTSSVNLNSSDNYRTPADGSSGVASTAEFSVETPNKNSEPDHHADSEASVWDF